MKKAFIILSAAALSLLGTSCEDWLDMPSYTDTDSETIFSDLANAELYVRGCYRGLIHSEQFWQYNTGDTVLHASEDGVTSSKYYIANFYFDTQTPNTLSTTYQEAYRIIESTNIAIDRLPSLPESAKRDALMAEVYAIRAFAYLNLIRLYGDVPAVWIPLDKMDPDAEETSYPHRTSRDVIYDRIISDIQNSVDALPTKAENPYGSLERLTRDAGYALLARIALYAGGYSLRWNLETSDPSTLKMARREDETRVRELYQIASDACEKVMGMSGNALLQEQNGMSGFHYLWYNQVSRNFSAAMPEMLWELAQYGATTNSDFNRYAHTGTRGGTFGSVKAMQALLPTFYLSYDPADKRRDVTCACYTIHQDKGDPTRTRIIDAGTTYSTCMLGKFRHNWRVQTQEAGKKENMNIPVLRYADVLLMYAEAQNYLNNGPSEAAKSALKEVRTRAGIGSMEIPTNREDFEEAVLQERKWELAGEMVLRTDIIRMNRMAAEVAKTQQAMENLSDRTGEYADVPRYRLYKLTEDAQNWADSEAPLQIDYIDITDPAEIAVVAAVPSSNKNGEYDSYQAELSEILRAHGKTVGKDDTWYPVNMFEAYTSSFNALGRKAGGMSNETVQIGMIMRDSGVGKENGQYPEWIKSSGMNGIYFGFKENCSELLPFAAKSAGHPIIDNPNLTQHPGYK